MDERIIYLIRHAETEKGTQKKYFIGQTDVDLSPSGVKQAEELAEKFKNIHLDYIYCSNLQRTIKTAQLIGNHHFIEPIRIEAIAEINMGEWDALSFEEIKSRYPLEYKRRGQDIINYCVPGGESFFEFSKRVVKGFYQILQKSSGNIAIVAHAGVNRVILCNILEIPLQNLFKISQDYCGINIIVYKDDKFKIKKINV